MNDCVEHDLNKEEIKERNMKLLLMKKNEGENYQQYN